MFYQVIRKALAGLYIIKKDEIYMIENLRVCEHWLIGIESPRRQIENNGNFC